MTSYGETVRRLQPVIQPLLGALQAGITFAEKQHGPGGFDRAADAHYWAHSARRHAGDVLQAAGLSATVESRLTRLSALLVQYDGIWLRVLRPEVRRGRVLVPVPGRSAPRQAFYRQDPVLDDLDGVTSDNALLLWQDVAGKLREPLTLVRPTGGDHLRRNLTLDWVGDLEASMANMRAADLNALQPRVVYEQMGGGSA